jgi:hypothetical protein
MDSHDLKYSSARAIVPIPNPSLFLLSGTGVLLADQRLV